MEIYYIRLTTIVSAIFFGVILLSVGRHMRVPAIVPLLVGGILLGPEFIGLINTDSLGSGLQIIISLCVAVILFEGGLTLKPEGFKKASQVIWRLLTFGVLITWFGTAAVVYLLFDYSMGLSMLAGSLIIVTGPTVIAPLLQRINIKEKLNDILHWEGVLIDPIGVFIAILCFEWFNAESSPISHFEQFSFRVLIGIGFGLLGGKIMHLLLTKKWIHEDQGNIFALAGAVILFGLSDIVLHEAGILTVVVAGLVLGWSKSPQLKRIKQFKSELTDLAIAFLFILLAANLDLQNFIDLGWKGAATLLCIMLLIRPLGILVSTFGTDLSTRARAFLSWIAPRGIVAGSMASLFALELTAKGYEEGPFIEAFTFSVIGVTIFIQGLSARRVAGLLGVREKEKNGWLIVGGHTFARKIARYIRKQVEATCIIVDTNPDAVRESRSENITAFIGNALEINTVPDEIRSRIGNVLALTDNRELNQLICLRWSDIVKKDRLFRWTGDEEKKDSPRTNMGIPVWQALTKPSQVSYDLRNKEANLISRTANLLTPDQLSQMIPLMAAESGRISVTDLDIGTMANASLLGYIRLVQHLPLFLQKKHILTIEHIASLEALLRHALSIAKETHTQLNIEQILKQLLAREDEIPTTLSNGVVMPHTRLTEIRQPICIFVRLQKGLFLDAHDRKKSRLFIIMLNPESDPETHLLMLADVAKIASDPESVDMLLNAISPEDVLAQLKSMENLVTGSWQLQNA